MKHTDTSTEAAPGDEASGERPRRVQDSVLQSHETQPNVTVTAPDGSTATKRSDNGEKLEQKQHEP